MNDDDTIPAQEIRPKGFAASYFPHTITVEVIDYDEALKDNRLHQNSQEWGDEF